jgi:hypothetical protein
MRRHVYLDGTAKAAPLLRRTIVALLLCSLALRLCAQEQEDTEPFFSLTSERTYLPGEKPTVSVYSHNVGTLEFRVYRINDPCDHHQGRSRPPDEPAG